MSWRLDRDHSRWFAERWANFFAVDAGLYTVAPPAHTVLAVLDEPGGRNESEAVIKPSVYAAERPPSSSRRCREPTGTARRRNAREKVGVGGEPHTHALIRRLEEALDPGEYVGLVDPEIPAGAGAIVVRSI